MKTHTTPAPTAPQTPWYMAEGAQVNFALFPDMFMAAPPWPPARSQAPVCTRRHVDEPEEKSLFVRFGGFIGGLIGKILGED